MTNLFRRALLQDSVVVPEVVFAGVAEGLVEGLGAEVVAGGGEGEAFGTGLAGGGGLVEDAVGVKERGEFGDVGGEGRLDVEVRAFLHSASAVLDSRKKCGTSAFFMADPARAAKTRWRWAGIRNYSLNFTLTS